MSSYISGLYRLSTNPAIIVSLSYETKRDNNHVYYRFSVEVQPSSQAFAYNLKMDITLNGKKILSGGTVKDIYPSKWTVPFSVHFPSKTGWYQVDNVESVDTLPCTVRFYSTQTSGTADSAGRVVYVPPAEDSLENVKIKVNSVWKNAVNTYIKVGGAWRKAEKVYIKINGIWRGV